MTTATLDRSNPNADSGRVYLHPLPVRIWHWLNALGFLLLIFTGIQIRYADLLTAMPFEAAVKLHIWTGFAVIANWFLWFFYYLTSDRVTNYHPDLDPAGFFRRFFRQVDYYARGMFEGARKPHEIRPFDKFNPMQKLTYQLVMFIMTPAISLTGLMLWDTRRFAGLIEAVGGIRVVNTVHVLLFIAFVFFIFIHAYMGMLGPRASSHYREMFTGYEERRD